MKHYNLPLWLTVLIALLFLDPMNAAEQKNVSANDAREEEWPVPTTVLHRIAGESAIVIQMGALRHHWVSGSLILIWDQESGAFDSLRIIRLFSSHGDYKAFKIHDVSKERQKRLMEELRLLIEVLKKHTKPVVSEKVPVGEENRNRSFWVLEMADSDGFRQVSSRDYSVPSSAQTQEVFQAFVWWYRIYVGAMVGSDERPPKWEGKELFDLPITFREVE